MSIYLHIDRLILDGLNLAPADRRRLAASLEAELARLLSAGGLADSLAGGAALAALRAADISIAPAASPAQLGAQIAQAVYAGLGREDSLPPQAAGADQ